MITKYNPELQIRGGTEDNSKIIFFLFFNKNIHCDPSLEPSLRESLMKGHSVCFFGEIWLIIP